jgi:hypothetical protein
MAEADIEIILERAKEQYPEEPSPAGRVTDETDHFRIAHL